MVTKRIEEIVARELTWIDEKYDRVLPTKPKKRRMLRGRKRIAHTSELRNSSAEMAGNKYGCRAVILTNIWGKEKRYNSVGDVAYALGINRHAVGNIIRGRIKNTKYRLRYAEKGEGNEGN